MTKSRNKTTYSKTRNGNNPELNDLNPEPSKSKNAKTKSRNDTQIMPKTRNHEKKNFEKL
jgi:hypothetical protein